MRRALWIVLLSVLFIGSCTALIKPATRLADAKTIVPLAAAPDRPFPLLVLRNGVPEIVRVTDLRAIPPLPAGTTYLVPEGAEESIARRVTPPHADGRWVLHVQRLAPAQQRIELYWMHNGYAGGIYDATATHVMPRYRKITGPGFAFIVLRIAAGISLAICAAVVAAALVLRSRLRWR
ncbi:MAG TPA: hypothetical protein VFN10_15180 [Thermoanaerobaculia bacterium]|nr:hypothetical protein [Thermoanaerobaculia bacterium]